MHPSGTLPAHEIDSFVVGELIILLGRQTKICRIIRADDPAQMDVAGAKAEFTAAELKLRPRRDLILQMVDKVTVGEKQISVAISPLRLRSLLTNTQASMQSKTRGTPEEPHLMTRAFQLKRCGHGKKLIIEQNNTDENSQPDPSLPKTIARAHAWFDDLKSGLSYKEIAIRDAIDERHVARSIHLALLAPDITKAILA